MYIQPSSFAFHMLGIVFWIGGSIVLSRVLRVFIAPQQPDSEVSVLEGREELYKACRAIWFGFVLGGLIVALVTGLVNISVIGASYYAKQAWFHTKLIAVLGLFVVTVLTGFQMAKLARGEVLQRSKLAMINGAASGLLLVTLLITYLGRVFA